MRPVIWLLVILAPVTGLGCGGHSPELGELSSVEAEVRRGREFFVTALVTDEAVDLASGAIFIEVASLDGSGASESADTLLLAGPLDQSFEVLAGITLGFTLDPGRIRVTMSVADGDGNRSEDQSLGLNLIR